MVARRKDVVVGEPDWPEASGEPGVSSSLWGVFSSDVEVNNPDKSAGLEHAQSVFDGGEPVGDHGQ